jgi:sugar/nucleoside kinase (ribokinase family)
MEVAFASMESLKLLKGDAFIPHLKGLEKEDILCADLNFEVDLLTRLFKQTKAKIYIEATSAHKVLKVHSLIPYIHGLKLNLLEAKVLTNQIEEEDVIIELEKMPLKEIILTAGEKGVYLINDSVTHYQDETPFEPINMSGVGDAFMAGYLLKSPSTFDQIRVAMTLSYLTAKSTQSTIESLDNQKFVKEKEKRHVRILSSRPRSTQ